MVIIFAGFFLRILLAVYNSYFELPGSMYDAWSFHLEGTNFKEYLNLKNTTDTDIEYKYREGGWIYAYFLGYLYYIFTTSQLMAAIISCFVWIVSALMLRNILIRLKINNFKINLALFFYTFVPTGILFTSMTLREVYMLFFTNFIVLLMIILKDQKKKIFIFLNIIIISLLFILLMFFHLSNIIFVLLFLIALFSFFLIKKLNLGKLSILLLCIIFIFALYGTGGMSYMFDKVKDYQMGHFHPITIFRATYYLVNDIQSLNFTFINFFGYIFSNIYNYFIQPSILRIASLSDLLLGIENFIRLFMIFIIITKLFKNSSNSSMLFIFFLMFILSELPYSQATINWGTASRHHLQTLGLLIVLFLYPLKNKR